MSGQVMLLNASYEPLGSVSFKHAVRMLFREVAIVEEGLGERMIGPHRWPRVIRLVRYVVAKWLYREAAWSRHGLFLRDRSSCGYCGGYADTVDHVVPASRGGPLTWTNTIAACAPCNHRKGNRTPAEAGMRMLWEPFAPTRAQLAAAC